MEVLTMEQMKDLALEIYTRNLLTRIAIDFNLPRAELDIKFMNAAFETCVYITGKKTRCTRRCIPGTDACGIHSKKAPEPPPFVREDDPGPSDGVSIDDRIKAILAEEEPEEEPPLSHARLWALRGSP